MPVPFVGLEWRLTAYRSDSGLTEVVPRSRPTEFRFEDGQFSGSTGCNRIQGAYTVEGADFRFGEGLAATRMACPGPLMQQEAAVIQAFQAVTRYRHTPDHLELLDEHGEIALRFSRLGAETPADPLLGRTWKLDSYSDGHGAELTPIKGTRIDLSFDPRGRISGSDGCNRYLGGFTRSGQALSIGPIATTLMACTASDAHAEQGRAYAELLGQVSAYRIENGHLLLLDANGAILARLQAMPAE
ncbi:META domain-containing protein [Allochromatium palmeri]|nr:META domain-containing protein [Allochromatium palmeri]